jgi:ABC-type lipoprotein release transport system permease subunit
MKRHLRILDHAVETLLHSPFKTAVIIVVYALLVAAVVSVVLYVDAHQREAEALLASAPELVVQRVRGGRHELMPIERAAVVGEIRGVGAVKARVWGYSYDPPTRATLTVWGAESVPEEIVSFREGELLTLTAGGSCVVGSGLAEARFLGVGDRLPFKCADGGLVAPSVKGVFSSESAMLSNDLVVMPTEVVRRIFGVDPGFCTDLAVQVYNQREVDTIARKVQELWPDVRTVSRRQMIQTYEAVFDWRGGIWIVVIAGAVSAFLILVWDKATGLTAEEYRNIGVLKAVGWKTNDVMELKAAEGLVISLVSLATGLVAAELHLVVFNGALFAPVIKGWSVLYPSFDVSPRLEAYTLLVCVPLAVLPYVAASLVPTWKAAVTDPDAVIRG